MRKISEILRQRYDLNLTCREVAQSLNVSTGTVYNYVARAKTAGISWPLPEGMSEQELHNKIFLPAVKSSAPRPLPDWEYINRERRKKGMTVILLWREYKEIHPNGLGYTQFCYWYANYLKKIS
jgi:transposase